MNANIITNLMLLLVTADDRKTVTKCSQLAMDDSGIGDEIQIADGDLQDDSPSSPIKVLCVGPLWKW